ncbi:MAG: hypothetical protein IPI35_25040 [Deltaproteobacteria bacterium]|nr:hypothetical protein [Deltaproteobacteria bacterium]
MERSLYRYEIRAAILLTEAAETRPLAQLRLGLRTPETAPTPRAEARLRLAERPPRRGRLHRSATW